MRAASPWRLGLMLGVSLPSIALVFPTAFYLLTLRGADPSDAATAERLERLRRRAIPLGLDLQGGVDVTLMIDETKTVARQVDIVATRLANEFRDRQISAVVEKTKNEEGIEILVHDRADCRQVHNILRNYDEELEGDLSQGRCEAAAESQRPFGLGLNPVAAAQQLDADIRGAERVLRERLDKLGLTQPSISVLGNKQIRIQIAGEKDPDRVIENITKLATMEFRLVHELTGTANDLLFSILDENGEVRPEDVPLGYMAFPTRFGRFDRDRSQMVYTEGKILVESGDPPLTGGNLRSATVFRDPGDFENPIKVSIQFDNVGADVFYQMTRDHKGRQFAIILDGVVRSAPVIREVIAGGSAVIEGGFTFEEAQDLSLLLKAGSLPAPLVPESKRAVEASLGTESIFAGVQALGWGTLLVIVFMIAYYGMAGVISVVALALNVFIILGIMALADATLTLSGIGGILLTVGMAVDANVLIYERVREEADAGRPLKQAISVGFERAFTVILDSNLTGLMTALVLLQFTEGSVFGFALTMTFGLLANLYTGLTVTHALCALWFQWRGRLSLGRLRPFRDTRFDFIRLRFVSGTASILLIAAALGIVVARGGLKFGVDFAGGAITEVRFAAPTDEARLRGMLAGAGLEGQRVQRIAGTEDWIVRVKTLPETHPLAQSGIGPLQATERALREALATTYGEAGYDILNFQSFGPETGQGFRQMAITVMVLASIAILIYLWVRFELVFGVAAVVALVHDLLITTLWGSAWGVEISLEAVAALMVLLGFSVNDTIVIFDRVRENSRRSPDRPFRDLCNLSMNQSLSRTLITSGTVVLVIVTMLLVGGEGLRPFAKILLIGSIVGTYSSDFIAAPLVYEWDRRRRKVGVGGVAAALAAKEKARGPEPARAPEARKASRGGLPKKSAV